MTKTKRKTAAADGAVFTATHKGTLTVRIALGSKDPVQNQYATEACRRAAHALSRWATAYQASPKTAASAREFAGFISESSVELRPGIVAGVVTVTVAK